MAVTVATTSIRATALSDQTSVTGMLDLLAKTNVTLLIDKPEPVSVVVSDGVTQKPPSPQPVYHSVGTGESLSSIAKQYDKPWTRLWDANTDLESPDLIHVGQAILIPRDDEVFESRPVPEPPAPVKVASRPAIPGNGYTYGYCTWYVKNKRPDIPNGLGNANTWLPRASAWGIPTGSAPAVGAVGWTDRGAEGHVVYVEAVNADGTIRISEMNYAGWNVKSYRTVSASLFQYIY